jgi:hypothetical protein
MLDVMIDYMNLYFVLKMFLLIYELNELFFILILFLLISYKM